MDERRIRVSTLLSAVFPSSLTTVRVKINHLTVHVQLQQRDQRDLARYQHALETLDTAEIEVEALIDDLKARVEKLSSQIAIAHKSRQEQLAKAQSQEQDSSDVMNGKGKEKESLPETQTGEDDDIKRRNGVLLRIREAEILSHKVFFFKGDLYHTLGAKYSKEEGSAYARAESIRKKLLKGDCKIWFKSSYADSVILVTEENAIRAIATMAEQTAGLDLNKLILPEDLFEKYSDINPPEGEGDGHQMEVDGPNKGVVGTSISGNNGRSKGKGKLQEKVHKVAKPVSDTKKTPGDKLKSPEQVIYELVGCSRRIFAFFNSQLHSSKKPRL